MALQVVAVACDWGAGQPGGMAGVLGWYHLGLYYKHLAWIEAHHHCLLPKVNRSVWVETGPHVYARRFEPWLAFAEEVRQHVQTLSPAEPILFLTGDHSWAGVILPTLASRVGTLGVIWIDAHADFHNPATSPSGNLHGMPMALATGLNTHRYHPVPDNTWKLWESAIQATIQPSNILFIGLRSYEPPEMELIQAHQIPFFTSEAIIQEGVKPALEAAQALAERCDALYVSFDVDVWDPSFARGTGSPAAGGLSIGQVRSLLDELLSWPKTLFLEVTEINPLLDRENQTALYAYGSIRSFIDGPSARPHLE
ncbi:MAG: arginase family protein [Bacteroidia bacterium]|nr:arginase family protein [Bacteroidia bacterium]